VSEGSAIHPGQPRAPFHLWIVGLLSLLWNAWGATIALTVQTGRLPGLRPEDAEYFSSQPLWFVLFADIAPFAGVAGALALLLRHRSAIWLYLVQLTVIVLANGYEVVVGTSLLLSNRGALIASLVLIVLFAGQIAYARRMRRRGVLD
jgi:hypothetical protein